MKRALPILAALCVLVPCRHARGQGASPASTAGGWVVIDAANLIRLVVDVALQRVQRDILARAERQAFSHYHRITQHVGVTVFQRGPVREALAPAPPAAPTSPYSSIYAHEYAPGIPEAEQDSAAQARMDSLTVAAARELEVVQREITILERQIAAISAEIDELLRAPAGATNRQGRLEQLQAALRAKASRMAALRARAASAQARHGAAQGLFAQQQTARYTMRVQRAAREYVPHQLTTPFVPEPRYGGIRQFLRFPGLRGSKQDN